MPFQGFVGEVGQHFGEPRWAHPFHCQRGWPDFLVLYDWLYGIELKRHGAQLSKTRIVRTRRGSPRTLVGQADVFPQLRTAGMRDIAVCYSVEEAIAALERWHIPLRGRVAA